MSTQSERGYCYIKCSPAFEEHVAKELPRGLAPFDPAFIQVDETRAGWEVKAVYIKDGVNVTLWKADAKPEWVGKLRKEKDDAKRS